MECLEAMLGPARQCADIIPPVALILQEPYMISLP